jgi:hypothetical protein|tara:strand:+ start:175 stop:750 length:576 start_codon:yes stop_codon:yes gene_type:complete
VISRKKKITLIQITIFLVASLLLYNTYRDKNEKIDSLLVVKPEKDINTNSFDDIEYSGFDLNGNRYVLNAGKADFKNETPENVNMKEVTANFYLKDGTILQVSSDEGLYNNITLDMEFKKNVKATYLTNTLFSDKLIYINNISKLLASGNVHGTNIEKGEFFADKVEYDLISKNLNFSMMDKKKVNIKIKN